MRSLRSKTLPRPSHPSSRAARPIGEIASLPRALSKLGFCSRTQACALIDAGRVTVDGQPARNKTQRVDLKHTSILVDGKPVERSEKIYLMMNKPRGLITTRQDPQQRGTVYDCLDGQELPFLSPVGRLDMASEGLLFMTNDTAWAEALLNPASNVRKHYHVKIDRHADEHLIEGLKAGIEDKGERLVAQSATLLRSGSRTSWLEIVLNEGRNRQIRRLLEAHDAGVQRLVRVSIGGVSLGDLGKGQVRALTKGERRLLAVSPP